jgi:hypothetical protein
MTLWDDAEHETRAVLPYTSQYALRTTHYALRPQPAVILSGEVNHANNLFFKGETMEDLLNKLADMQERVGSIMVRL